MYAMTILLRELVMSVVDLCVKTMEQEWMSLQSAIIVGREGYEY